MNKTSIEWCSRPETRGPEGARTWNPIRARLKGASPKARSGTFCTRISPGCQHCYASTINKRFGNGLEFTVPNLEQIEFFIDERILAEPIQAKKPCTIFVGDMFDLFHESIPGEFRINGNRPYCPKCNELARLLLECRDALPAISLSSAKLHNVSLSLSERIEDALEPWKIEN